jgi:Ca2+-binding RTX toxin-like protein
LLSGGNSGATPIDISGDTTAGQVAATVFTAINTSHTGDAIDITPTNPAGDAIIPLTADTAGEAANVTIATSTSPKFVVAGMSGGSDEQPLDDGEAGELDSIASDVENVMGGAGSDTINASASGIAHVLMGMAGADTLTGAGDVDYLYGGAGNDTLIGGGGADFLFGGADNDFLQGGTSNDTINGGGATCVAVVSAADPVVPFVNATTCTTKIAAPPATPGIDTLDYGERGAAVTVNLTSLDCAVGGTVVGVAGECDIVTSGSIRNIRGGGGADTLTGDAQDNVIWGGAGNDTISGGEGNDSLYGGIDVDTINGGAGNDYVAGGAGTANILNGDDGLDTVDASMGTSDVVNCGAGDGDILILGTTTVNASGTCEM